MPSGVPLGCFIPVYSILVITICRDGQSDLILTPFFLSRARNIVRRLQGIGREVWTLLPIFEPAYECVNPRRHSGVDAILPEGFFFANNSRKSGLSRRNCPHLRVNQFYIYSENLLTLTQMTFELWPTFRYHVWPGSRFGVCWVALAASLQSFRNFKGSNMCYDAGSMN